MITAIAPGTKVKLGGETPAIVTGVTIRQWGITGYEVVYWSGTTRNSVWVEPCEVTVTEEAAEPLQVGFGGEP